MVRRGDLIKKKPKVVRKNRSEMYLANLKFLGDEPEYKVGSITSSQYADALTWYNYMCDVSDAREYMNTLLIEGEMEDLVILFKKVPDNWVPITACWTARLLSRNYDVDGGVEYVMEKLEESFNHIKEVSDEEEVGAVKPTVQDKIKVKCDEIIGNIESLIDTDPNFSLYRWLTDNKVPTVYANNILVYYIDWLAELCDVTDTTDKQLKEAYSHFTRKQLLERISFFNTMIEDAERYASNVKKARKPRTSKPLSTEKILKHLKYQKECPEYKLVSLSPEKIIGVRELWVANTRYKTLTVFRNKSADHPGLSVKGTTIIEYDEVSSVTKRLGRSFETKIHEVLGSTRHRLLTYMMKEVKGDAIKLQSRINENVILLRIGQ